MIKSNKPLVVQIDARSGNTISAEVVIKITEVRLLPEESIYQVDIQDLILNTVGVAKSVALPIAQYEALKAHIVQVQGFTEQGTALDLKVMPYALLHFVLTDVRADGKLIYGSVAEDWELMPIESN